MRYLLVTAWEKLEFWELPCGSFKGDLSTSVPFDNRWQDNSRMIKWEGYKKRPYPYRGYIPTNAYSKEEIQCTLLSG
jgi:hypothetical protein